MAIFKNVASQKLAVFAYDSTDGSAKTGDAANITAQISKDGGVTAATNDVNPTELDATDAPGVYIFDMTAAETNADLVILAAVSATANILLEPLIIYPGADVVGISGDTTAADNLESYSDGTTPQPVNVTQISGDSTAADNLELDYDGTGYAKSNSTMGTVTTLTGHTAQTGDNFARLGAPAGASVSADIATINGNVDSILTDTKHIGYNGPRGPGVYLNDAAGNTNTTLGTDGTVDNPVSTIAAAKTIADGVSFDRIYLVNDSDITLAATMTDYEFVGIGEITGNIVNLGSQDVSNSYFENVAIEGTQGGSGRILAIGCALQDPGAGDTTLHIFACFCGIVDRIQVDTSADNIFDQCYSLVAGTSAPIIQATGAAGTIAVRHYSGGIEFESLSASHNVSVETDGQVIFAASCNVNATVAIRGNATITDNTGGMAAISDDARYDVAQVNAECDTAISDAALATAAALTTAQNDLDIITGSDGTTLATTQGNYAPSTHNAAAVVTALKADTEWKEILATASGKIVIDTTARTVTHYDTDDTTALQVWTFSADYKTRTVA